MARQGQGWQADRCSHAHDLRRAVRWLLAGVSLGGIVFRTDCTWTPRNLVSMGLLWAWSDELTLWERFATARKIIRGGLSGQPQPATSYQAFIKMLRKWTRPLLEVLRPAFRERMTEVLARVWTIEGWAVFAADGSKVDVPRTRKNEQRYAPKTKLARRARKRRSGSHRRRTRQTTRERKANVPRIWMTVLWHVGSGLPWNWRTGPSDSSERGHLKEMLSSLPPRGLLAADAGFVGYDLWKTVLAEGHQLLVRVGSNVTLLKKLGYARERNGLVYLWPDQQAKKRQPPLVLRLVIASSGRHPVYLVTSILDHRVLSDRQVIAVYRRRWGIEVYYRHCKQTFQRRKLRSHNPDNALIELHWSLLAMWAMGLHSHTHLVRRGVSPQRISFANVWRAYRRSMREYQSRPDPGERLTDLLDRAVLDPYQRKNKTSRDYPRKKQPSSTGPPTIRKATPAQVQQAKQVKREETKRLTA